MAYAKKGGATLLHLALISIMVSIFIFSIIIVAKAYASGKIALKAAAAKDIALLLDSMYASPFDARAEYDIDLSDFRVVISHKEVSIEFPSLSVDPAAKKYPFVPINDNPDIILNNPKKIIFEKKNGALSATGVA